MPWPLCIVSPDDQGEECVQLSLISGRPDPKGKNKGILYFTTRVHSIVIGPEIHSNPDGHGGRMAVWVVAQGKARLKN
jgi:hypothetical protein